MGPACGILSGSSSCARQFSHHSFTSTHLRNDLCLPPSSQLHLLTTPHSSNHILSNCTLHNLFYIFHLFFKKKTLHKISHYFPKYSTLDFSLTSPYTHCVTLLLPCIIPSPPPLAWHSFTLVECLPSRRAFTATTLSRPWNSVASTAWLGLALAASYALYAAFGSPSQAHKLSGI